MKRISLPILAITLLALLAGIERGALAKCQDLVRRAATLAQIDASWTHNRSWNVWAVPEQLRTGDLFTVELSESALKDGELEKVGDFSNSPFNPRPGVIRLFVHYRDLQTQNELTRYLTSKGIPFKTGKTPAKMHSSRRTVFPLGDEDFGSLKLTGHWETPSKRLTPESVRWSNLRSNRHLGDSEIIPETAGLIFRYGDQSNQVVTGIYRPSELGGLPEQSMRPGEKLYSLSTLLSPSFWKSADSQFIRKHFRTALDWLNLEFAPRYAKFILNSTFTRGSHLETHSQNLNVVLDRLGRIRMLAGKDLTFAGEDAVLQMAMGFPMGPPLSFIEYPFLNDSTSRDSRGRAQSHLFTLDWYRSFSGQIDMAIQKDLIGKEASYEGGKLEEFQGIIQDHLIRETFRFFQSNGLDPNRRSLYGQAFSDLKSYLIYGLGGFSVQEIPACRIAQPYGTLSRLRELFLFLDMEKEFKFWSGASYTFGSEGSRYLFQDPAVAPQPLDGKPKIENWFLAKEHSVSDVRWELTRRGFVFGTYRGKPTAIRYRPNGTIENYVVDWGPDAR